MLGISVNQSIGSIVDAGTVIGTMTFSSNANRGLIISAGAHQASIGTLTVNGTTLTSVASGTTTFNERVNIYYLNAPPAGGVGTIQAVANTSAGVGITASEINGVAQTGQPVAVGSSTGTSGTAAGTLTPGGYNYMLYQAGYSEGSFVTLGGSPLGTQISNLQKQSFENLASSYQIQPSNANDITSWVLSSSQRWANAFVSLQPAGINLDSVGTGGNSNVNGTISSTHTIVSNTNSIIVALVSCGGTATLNAGPKFAGNNMTKVVAGTQSTGLAYEAWYLLAPPTGLGTFNGTYGNSQLRKEVITLAYTNVDQTTPIIGSQALGQSISNVSGSLTNVGLGANNMYVGGLALDGSPGTTVIGIERGTPVVTNEVIGNDSPGGTLRWTFSNLRLSIMIALELGTVVTGGGGAVVSLGYRSLFGVGI